MEVLGLWRYPVKSLLGEHLDAAQVEQDGIRGDRAWGIRDNSTGRILTARRRPELLGASSSYDGDDPVIVLPGGQIAVGAGAETDRALSAWLATPVSLVASAGDAGRAEYFADATDDTSQAIEWTMPTDRYVDAAPVLVVTTASLRAARDLYPEGAWDPRRFRPNILLDVAEDGWVEDGWVGQAVQVGPATLLPTQPCIRCTMVTREQPGLGPDADIFRTLARHHGGHFGVWSDVLAPGTVAVGDRTSVAAP